MLISEIIPLMRPRTLAAAFSPVFIGATFSYYAFGAAHGERRHDDRAGSLVAGVDQCVEA